MNKNHQRLLVFGLSAAFVVGLGAASQALAVSADSAGVTATANAAGIGSSKTLPVIIGQIIRSLLGLVGVVLVCLFVYAGFLWMTAQGEQDKVKKAKGILVNAVVGMIIIFSAYSITSYVMQNVIKSTLDGSGNGALSEQDLQACLQACADGSITVDPSAGLTCEQSCRK